MSAVWARVDEIAFINPRQAIAIEDNDAVSFLGMADVSELGKTNRGTARSYLEVKKGHTAFVNGDLLLAKITPCFENGKIAQANLDHTVGFGSTEFHVVRPKPDKVDARYLLHLLRGPEVRREGEMRMIGSAGQKRIPAAFVESLKIPLPPLPEQRRIAAILDQADELRARRRRALTLLDELADSVYADMFGSHRMYETDGLLDICQPYSGGTPSKGRAEYWVGDLPWFSPKDLKASDLFDAIDHVNPVVLQDTTLRLMPADTVAIVVRGMILAHTFPVARLRVPCTINQDMKALLPKRGLDPAFLAHALRSQSSQILASVSTAGHGTKRLDAKAIGAIRIPRASIFEQRRFRKSMDEIETLRAAQRTHDGHLADLFASLQHRAFRGEL